MGTGPATVKIGLPDTTRNLAVRDPSGTLVYADDFAATDVAVQPTGRGVRVLVTLKDESAPRIFRFPVTGPEGPHLVLSSERMTGAHHETGDVLLVGADRRVLGLFEPAWAKDAHW